MRKKSLVLLVGFLVLMGLAVSCASAPAAPTAAPAPAATAAPQPAAAPTAAPAAAPTAVPAKPAAVEPTKAPAAATGAPIVLKLQNLVPATNANYIEWVKVWHDEVTKRTNGRVTFQVSHACSLVPCYDTLDAVKLGIADVAWMTSLYWVDRFPVSLLLAQPYTFPDAETAFKVWPVAYKGEIGAEWRRQGVEIVAATHTGTSVLVNVKRPVKTLEDFKGLKVRVPGKVEVDWMTTFGASPVIMALAEALTGMKSGTVDGVTQPWSAVKSLGLLDSKPYITDMGLNEMIDWNMGVSLETWNKMPPDVQQAMKEAGQVAADHWREFFTKDTKAAIDAATATGKVEVMTPAEIKRLADATKPVVDKWVNASEASKAGWREIQTSINAFKPKQ